MSVAYGDLKIVLLGMLEDRPYTPADAHAHLIAESAEYLPSAGSIYPRLAAFLVHGLATREGVERHDPYVITQSGREYLRHRREHLERARKRLGLPGEEFEVAS